MKWITRERVKVDRVACPWLIRKFVDKDAEFLFVPASAKANSRVAMRRPYLFAGRAPITPLSFMSDSAGTLI